ncbi:MAG TPA: tetratricopeptide repeat protein [Steroidobacteraceae bacterium]|nr:tetratricopeptide repeat protein [Steroidobacteraceae bacterium]
MSRAELTIITLLFLLGGGIFWVYGHDEAASAAANAPSASVRPAVATDPSVAVLPFVDMSENKDQEYFADGLAEELLNLLAGIPELRVIGRTSSFQFKGRNEDLRLIATKLGVANLLEGSVRKSGNRVRITAQLIKAADASHLWSETYERDLGDIFKVQDEISSAVVAALQVKLLPQKVRASAPYRTTSLEAYNEYLLGRQFFNRGSADDFRRAVTAYGRAVELDPMFASAYAGLAVSENEVARAPGNTLAEVRAAQARALVAADRAVELDPGMSEGYAARGFLRFNINWDWAGAEEDLSRAFELDPGSYRAYTCYACFLASLGRLDEALEINLKGTRRDPLSADTWFRRSIQLNAAGRYAEARAAANRALEISPEHGIARFNLGVASLLEGNPEAALAEFERASAGRRQTGVAMAAADLGRHVEAQRALDELIDNFAQSNAYQIAEVYAWRNERDSAFAWLERAYAQHDGTLVQIKFDPLLARIRDDVRYAEMLVKMGLPP